jgi:hypothetical protein
MFVELVPTWIVLFPGTPYMKRVSAAVPTPGVTVGGEVYVFS